MTPATGKIPIVHVINSFEFGGAEAMLGNLLCRTDRTRFEPTVVSLIDDMTVADPVIKADIPITVIGMKPGVPDPRHLGRLAMHLRRLQPAIVQTWMDHSNLLGGLAARLATRAKIVWGVHHSNHVRGVAKRSTLLTVSACAKLSRRVPDRIVLCSELSRTSYTNLGFAPEKLTVIPNGFDTTRFKPDADARTAVRAEIGVDDSAFLVGFAARFDPVKDPATFLRAAALLAGRFPQVRFVIYGANMDRDNAELMAIVNELGLADRVLLLGPRHDVPRVHAAMDLMVLSSVSEAFPLVLGEAMACGVPCVSTDVGDAALILGDTGQVTPIGQADKLADACAAVIAMTPADRAALGAAARQRVCDLFDLNVITRRYEDLYRRLLTAETVELSADAAEMELENVVG